jgi:hypothetical protein
MSAFSEWEQLKNASHPAFTVIQAGIKALSCCSDFPTVSELDQALSPLCGVHFELQLKTRARAVPADSRYNGQIATVGQVPTREKNLHDLLNALIWVAFPKAKQALHQRQHLEQGNKGEQPGVWVRNRTQDILSMLDEGGVLLCDRRAVVFGHAILEHLVKKPEQELRVLVLPLVAEPDLDMALSELLKQDPFTSYQTALLGSLF